MNRQKLKEHLEHRIGLLRQWLNEDRITEPSRMVTNKHIEIWLDMDSLDAILDDSEEECGCHDETMCKRHVDEHIERLGGVSELIKGVPGDHHD